MNDHYFTSDPAAPERRQLVLVDVWGRTYELESASGVFAAGRLDVGTAVLFRVTEPPKRPGNFVDLGCGYGVVACALAMAVPRSEVWAVDVNARAVQVTADNAARLDLADRIHAVQPDAVPRELRFDELWSNPPIRIGKQALHELLLEWLPRLVPGGRAVLVVGKNLGSDSLQRWITAQGYPCGRLGSAKGFRVLEARRPR